MNDTGVGTLITSLCSLGNHYRLPVTMIISHHGSPGEPIGAQVPIVAKACGIESSVEVSGAEAAATLKAMLDTPGPHVIVARVAPGSPKLTPIPLSSLVIRDRFRDAVRAVGG